MEGWKKWMGKKVFIVLKSDRKYSGEVIEVELSSSLAWITIKDRNQNIVGFSTEEIKLIQEESQ